MLMFFPPDADHSVWWFCDDAGRLRRAGTSTSRSAPSAGTTATVAGVDIVDQDLDVVVAPDRTWQWKDEDEFTERLAFPDHYWVPDEQAVRAEGRRVIKQTEAGRVPVRRHLDRLRARPGLAGPRRCRPAGTGPPLR